jgi:hypothetical protein
MNHDRSPIDPRRGRCRPRGARLRALTVISAAALTTAGCASSAAPAATSPPAATMPAMAGMSGTGAAALPGQMHLLGSDTWQGMTVELASMPPQPSTVFEGQQTKPVIPTGKDSVHLMAVLADAQSHERIPYASCWVTVTDGTGKVVFDERLWPMISRDVGTHYGTNVALPGPGRYSVRLRVGPPQAARHPEYTGIWLVPYTMTVALPWSGR